MNDAYKLALIDELRSPLTKRSWETGLASPPLQAPAVLERLDYASYFALTSQVLPEAQDDIFNRLQADRLVQAEAGKRWSITNLGAILLATQLTDFPPAIARKAIRFVAYDGTGRADTVIHRKEIQGGYGPGLNQLIDYLSDLLPRHEKIVGAVREETPLYPLTAIREIVANALIHQDMTIAGTGPLIELFAGRMEVTNPGLPLVKPDRFIDFPPRSRNESLASLMRRMGLCEEQGTGIDKVIVAVEQHQLPPPDFRIEGDALRVKLFAPRCFAKMTADERLRACYQHAVLKYLASERMNNSSLRTRLGIGSNNAAQASSVIRRALDAKLIKPADPAHPRSGYIPFWA